MQRVNLSYACSEITFQHGILNFEPMKTQSFARQFYLALVAYRRAFSFVKEEGLRHWYLIITAGAFFCMWFVRLVLGAGAGWIETEILTPFRDNASAATESWGWVGWVGWDWVAGGLERVVEWLVFVFGLWIQFKVTKFIVLIVLSPLYAIFAELIARRIRGSAMSDGGERGWQWSLWRGLRSALLLVGLEVGIGVILSVIFLFIPLVIPAIGVVTWWLFPFISGAVSIGFYGAAVLDYAWEQTGYDARQSLHATSSVLGAAMALGLPFYVLMALPFAGWLAGPLFGGMICVVAALTWSQHDV